MITEQDLQEAIAECEGQRKPGANTCMMLAAFYTIKDHLYPENMRSETYQSAYPVYMDMGNNTENTDNTVKYSSNSDFGQAITGKNSDEMWGIIDELMDALIAINPRLYDSVMRKIKY